MANFKARLIHIIKNKQIVLASIILCLALVFVFSADRSGRARVIAQVAPQEGYVIKAQENIIQPIGPVVEENQTDSIIYEKPKVVSAKCDDSIFSFDHSYSSGLPADQFRLPILMYHYVDEPGSSTLPWLYHPPTVFEAQLKTLATNCYQTVLVSEIGKALDGGEPLSKKSIALTFDDGYADMYTQAYPLLKKYNMKGTMYIIVNALDKPGYLTSAQAKEMAESGFVEIAAHTMNHADLNKSTWGKAKYEIEASRIVLEKIIGQPVTDFAYPYGFFTRRDEQLCFGAGYLSCASTYPGSVQTYDRRFSLYRLRPGYRVGPALINWLELSGPKR